MNIQNKWILVTGSSSGIGAATARELALQGAIPVLCARRKEELERWAMRIGDEAHIKIPWICADITVEQDREKIFQFIKEENGVLHGLINNAGITAHGRFDATNLSVLKQTMEVNFFAMTALTHKLLPLLKEAPGKSMIVLVSTVSGLYGVPGRFAYSASKSAGHAVMEALRIELKKFEIHTLIFCPGYTATNLRSNVLDSSGKIVQELQADNARTPEYVAKRLINAIRKEKRIVFTNKTGGFVFWLRTLAPWFLENLMAKKLRSDYET